MAAAARRRGARRRAAGVFFAARAQPCLAPLFARPVSRVRAPLPPPPWPPPLSVCFRPRPLPPQLGYKAKQGFVVYRVAVRRGGRKRPVYKGIVYGKPKHQGIFVTAVRNLRSVAEERIGRRCGNLRVLNSYWVNQDGTYNYYEVILVDPSHNAIRNDPRINWIARPEHKHREQRGLTSAGRQYRGLRHKGHRRHALIGGSRRAAWKRRNLTKLHRYR